MVSQYKNHAAVWTTSIEQIHGTRKGDIFGLYLAKFGTGLPVLVVALSVFQQLQMFKYKSDAM